MNLSDETVSELRQILNAALAHASDKGVRRRLNEALAILPTLDPFEEFCEARSSQYQDSIVITEPGAYDFGCPRWVARIIWDAALVSHE